MQEWVPLEFLTCVQHFMTLQLRFGRKLWISLAAITNFFHVLFDLILCPLLETWVRLDRFYCSGFVVHLPLERAIRPRETDYTRGGGK